jgi:hypothetical protein
MPANPKTADDLLRVFDRQNPDGTYVYSDHEIREILPLLALCLSNDMRVHPMPAAIAELMDELAAKLGIAESAPPAEVQSAVDAYYQRNPLQPELLASFQVFVDEVLESNLIGS